MLDKLKKYLGIFNYDKDEELKMLIDKSVQKVLSYTNRKELPISLENIVVELAIIDYNKTGAEGEESRSEGGVSHSYINGFPEDIKAILNRYIKARVV